ncbi:MAG: sigma-54 dependent transcriptional regulator [Myxococcota bacterium]
MSARVLIVDDDVLFQRTLARALRAEGFEVSGAHSAAEAREALPREGPDVVVLDYQLPDANGLGLLEELQPDAEGASFVMATAFPDLDVAVKAMHGGAQDYVAKGGAIRECVLRIQNAARAARLQRSVAAARSAAGGELGLLGDSLPMRALRKLLDKVAQSDTVTVQILGETGTGKGIVARVIHAGSGRAASPFVAVDCTTIQETLFESEIFGHEKGAFSGASGTKPGMVEAAGHGTLFLDEIGELDLGMQAKLLRLLEEGEYTRVGSTRTRRLEARIIAATNRDLEQAVAEGRFRQDLLYRLAGFSVETPPLRERGDDVELLATHFAEKHARAIGRPAPRIAAPALEALRRYGFPGNVRELRNMVEQALLLASGDELLLRDFPVLLRAARRGSGATRPRLGDAGDVGSHATSRNGSSVPPEPPAARRRPTARPAPPGGPTLEDIKREAAAEERLEIVEALRVTGGNVTAAAKVLGLSRHQLIRRMRKHGVS